MRQSKVEDILIGSRMEPGASPVDAGSRLRKVWNYAWGLLFVIAMTVLSVYCTQLGVPKAASHAVTVVQDAGTMAPAVK